MRIKATRRLFVASALFALVLVALLLPASSAFAKDEVKWQTLEYWINSDGLPSHVDISALSVAATPDRDSVSFEVTLSSPSGNKDLGLDSGNMLRVYIDTDLDGSTGIRVDDGLGADFLVEFAGDENGYVAKIWDTPSDDPGQWTLLREVPAHFDDSIPEVPRLGVDFPAALIGSPRNVRVDGYFLWKSPTGEQFHDWVPDFKYGEVAIRSPYFSDESSFEHYWQAVRTLSDTGIIDGYSDHTFRGSQPVWRQQFAKMIVCTLGLPVSEADACPFSDVTVSGSASLYPDNYVAVCAARGITLGKTAGHFDPQANITRAQLISMVVRALTSERPGLLQDPPSSYMGTWGNFSSEHQAAAKKAEYNGLLDGISLPSLSPSGAMPRGEVAQVLCNVLGLLDKGRDEVDTGLVTKVIDGGTIEVMLGGVATTVRLIGVDAPETGQDFAAEAAAMLGTWVDGMTVRIETDVQQRDQDGHLLAFVWVDSMAWVGGMMVNSAILGEGLATLHTAEPNVKYASRLQAAQDIARAEKRGMWAGSGG